MAFVRNLAELNRSDTALAGGKGAWLGELIRAGIPVPPGFAILTPAFEQFLDAAALRARVDSMVRAVDPLRVSSMERASERIGTLIAGVPIPQDISAEIMESFRALGAESVAVRSSATAEDGATAAWAGQLESYLNTVEPDLLENVKQCWASLFSPRALGYRFRQGRDGQSILPAVVVQRMIASQVSGTAFSAHPVTGDRSQLVIEAGWGLGEAVASGHITPDCYVVDRREKNISEKIVQVQVKALAGLEGGGNVWQTVAESKQGRQKLSDPEVRLLAELVIRVADYCGFPVDVEWAKADDQFFILQSRPITALEAR